jgi:hypothetical protein
MKKLTTTLLLLSLVPSVTAQNIGINVNGATPAASALLDIDASALPANAQRGLLIPRLALTATNVAAPVTAPATSLLIYNTATAGAAPFNVVPGFYYWNSAAWTPMLAGPQGWTILGNAGTVPATNFLGTTDNQDLVVRTNNTERMRVLGANGRVGIGLSPTLAQLEVNSGTTFDAIAGHSTNVGGYLGRETNISFGVPVQTLSGAGVYASNPAAGYTSIFSQSTGTANVAATVNYSSVWIGQYSYVENSGNFGTNSPTAIYGQMNNNNSLQAGIQPAMWGYSNRGTQAGNPGYTVGGLYFADAQNQDAIAVFGSTSSNSALVRMGGYFEGFDYNTGLVGAYAYVGGSTNGGVTLRKITGTGSVAEIVPTADHGRVTLTCPESPEYWYQDYGTAQLVDGHAHVDLDPILADIVVVDAENPVRVFCTPVDMPMFNGVTVTNRTATGFDLVELNGGAHNGKVDYQLVAKPKTNFGEGRFAQAPGPAWLKPDLEPAAAKAANQPKEVFHWPTDWNAYAYDIDKVAAIGTRMPAGPHKGKFKVAEGLFLDNIPATRPTAPK